MEKFKNLILVTTIVVLLLLLALSRCEKPIDKPIVTTKVEYRYKKGKTDTVYFKADTVYIKLAPTRKPVPADTNNYYYETPVEDSLLSGNIASVVSKDGTLIAQDFSYLPKFPKYINRTDTLFKTITNTTTLEEKDWGLYGGLMVGVYPEVALIPTIGFKTKKDIYLGIGYDGFNQTALIDVKFKLIGK